MPQSIAPGRLSDYGVKALVIGISAVREGGRQNTALTHAKMHHGVHAFWIPPCWHSLEAKVRRERAEELTRVVKQAIDDYLPHR